MKDKSERQSNFELMRIISMLFIIIWHIIFHGHMLQNSYNQAVFNCLVLIRYVIVVHVNSFIILMGYFQSKSKFKMSKFLRLIGEVIVYSVIIYIIGIKIGLIGRFDLMALFKCIDEYWFIKNYLIVYILSDYINKFVDCLSKNDYKKLLILLFLIFSVVGVNLLNNSGYNFYHFIFLYLVGCYLRKYPIKDSNLFNYLSVNKYKFFLIVIFFVMVFINYFLLYMFLNPINYNIMFNNSARIMYELSLAYASPFIIMQSICYFEFFRYINIKSIIINFISSCVLGIYLFHDNYIVRSCIYRFLKIDNGVFYNFEKVIYLFWVTIIIFVIGFGIEIIRKLIIRLLKEFKLIKKFR